MAEATGLRNNALPYPIYGAPFGVVVPIFDNDGDLVAGAADLDSERSLNGDTFADCTNEATQIATDSGIYYLLLTAPEMTADVVAGIIKTSTANAKTTPFVIYPRKLVTVRSGTAAGGDTAYITLDAGASAEDDYYNGMVVIATIDSNVEARMIADYTGSNKRAAVTPAWNVAPDADDTFVVKLPEGVAVNQARLTAAGVDDIWDENMTAHNVKNSAAKFLRQGGGGTQVTLITGTAAAATSTTITLDASAAAVADIYNLNLVVITGGVGAGQTRRIIDYSAARVATVDLAWVVTPNATSTYELVAAPTSYLADEGTVQAAGATAVQLATTAPAGDDVLNNALVTITGGTGLGQTRVITDYAGLTRTATVAAWDVIPDTTSTYAVIPAAAQAPDSGGGSTAPTTTEIALAVQERLNDLSSAEAQAASAAALVAYDAATGSDVSAGADEPKIGWYPGAG